MNEIIGVVGTGIGASIAQAFAEAGFKVYLKSRSLSTAKDVKEHLIQRSSDLSELISENIILTNSWSDLKGCYLVIESVLEDFNCKVNTYHELESVVSDDCIIASNTSSLSIDRLAEKLNVPERFLGLHFFNPPTKMELVELVKGVKTRTDVVDRVKSFIDELGKTALVLSDSPCFVVNRMLMPLLNEAVLILENGIANKEDIDMAAKLGLHHPMGPFKLLDFIGLDVFVEIMRNLYSETGDERYIPAKLAVDMVDKGMFGRKSGVGFYNYKK